MKANFSATILPMSFLCVAFGFFFADWKQTLVKKIVTVYCSLLTVCLFTSGFFLSLRHIRYMEYSFTSVTQWLLQAVLTSTFTYYRVKYILEEKVIGDILSSVRCVDKYLRHMGVNVPHKWNCAFCTIYTAALGVTAIIWSWFTFKALHLPDDTVMSTYMNAFLVIELFIPLAFSAQLMFILFIINQRIGFVRCAADIKYDNFSKRRVAWRCNATGSLWNVSMRPAISDNEQHYITDMKKIYNCVYFAFQRVKYFYAQFLCLHFIICVFMLSISLKVLFNDFKLFHFKVYVMINVIQNISTVFLCGNIRGKFNYITVVIAKFHCSHRIKISYALKTSVKYWLYQAAHQEAKFDCGFFEINSEVLLMLLDMVALFMLTMFS